MRKHKGSLLHPDDFEVGKFIAVLSVKDSDQALPFAGHSAEIKAIQLPFLCILPVNSEETVTIDTRYLNLIAVDEAFVKAQTAPPRTQNNSPQEALFNL